MMSSSTTQHTERLWGEGIDDLTELWTSPAAAGLTAEQRDELEATYWATIETELQDHSDVIDFERDDSVFWIEVDPSGGLSDPAAYLHEIAMQARYRLIASLREVGA